MIRPRSFVADLVGVVAGVFFLMMTAAFLMIPYSMSAHPGEVSIRSAAEVYHPT